MYENVNLLGGWFLELVPPPVVAVGLVSEVLEGILVEHAGHGTGAAGFAWRVCCCGGHFRLNFRNKHRLKRQHFQCFFFFFMHTFGSYGGFRTSSLDFLCSLTGVGLGGMQE